MPSFIDVILLSLISRNQKFILLPTDNSSKSKEYTVDTFWVYVLRSLLNELSVNGGEEKKKKNFLTLAEMLAQFQATL